MHSYMVYYISTSKIFSVQLGEVPKIINFDAFQTYIMQLLRNVIKPGFQRERPLCIWQSTNGSGPIHLNFCMRGF